MNRKTFGVKKILKIFLGLLIIPSFVFAVDYTPKNLPGGWVFKVVEAKSSPGTFYAVSYGVYKSTDGGRTWTRKPYPSATKDKYGYYTSFGRHISSSIAVSPNDANLIIVGDEQDSPLWRSANGGDTWTKISLDSDEYSKYKMTNMVAFSLKDPNYVFASSRINPSVDTRGDAILYISKDAGVTWSATSLNVGGSRSIIDALQIPSGRLLVTVTDSFYGSKGGTTVPTTGKIYYSDNDGNSFNEVSFTSAPYKMTWDPTNSKIWVIDSQGKVYSSSDGITWTYSGFQASTGTSATNNPVYKIVYFAGTTPTLFVGTDINSRVYKNTSSGFSGGWNTLSFPVEGSGKQFVMGSLWDIVIDSRDSTGNSFGVGTMTRYCYTTDSGANFTLADGINTNEVVYGIKDEATNRIYVDAAALVFYSPDNGDTWKQVYPTKDRGGGGAMLPTFHPTDTKKVYLCTGNKILVTNNNGDDYFNTTFIDFSTSYPVSNTSQLTNLLIHPSNPNIMYVGYGTTSSAGLGNYLYKSTDAGISWTPISSLSTHGIFYLAFDPNNPDIIYASCGNGFGPGSTTGTGDGLYRSTDAGATWTNLGLANGRHETISFDPSDTKTMWVGGSYNQGFDFSDVRSVTHMTIDGGQTWSLIRLKIINTGSTDGSVTTGSTGGSTESSTSSVLGTSRVFYFDSVLYSGHSGGEIYKSEDKGKTWVLLMMLPQQVNWLFKELSGVSAAPNLSNKASSTNTKALLAASGAGVYSITGISQLIGQRPYSGSEIKVFSFPNPFNPNTDTCVIRLGLPNTASNIKFRIYTLSGDLVVESEFTTTLSSGTYYAFSWDGKNQNGELCAPGLYFVIVNVDGTIVRHKIILVR